MIIKNLTVGDGTNATVGTGTNAIAGRIVQVVLPLARQQGQPGHSVRLPIARSQRTGNRVRLPLARKQWAVMYARLPLPRKQYVRVAAVLPVSRSQIRMLNASLPLARKQWHRENIRLPLLRQQRLAEGWDITLDGTSAGWVDGNAPIGLSLSLADGVHEIEMQPTGAFWECRDCYRLRVTISGGEMVTGLPTLNLSTTSTRGQTVIQYAYTQAAGESTPETVLFWLGEVTPDTGTDPDITRDAPASGGSGQITADHATEIYLAACTSLADGTRGEVSRLTITPDSITPTTPQWVYGNEVY